MFLVFLLPFYQVCTPQPLSPRERGEMALFNFRSILAYFDPFCIWDVRFRGVLRAVSLLSFLYLCR